VVNDGTQSYTARFLRDYLNGRPVKANSTGAAEFCEEVIA
jgi:hypothetical protein